MRKYPVSKCAVANCGMPAPFGWHVCALGEFHLCAEHDVEMNRVLIEQLGRSPETVRRRLRKYRRNPAWQNLSEGKPALAPRDEAST